MHNGIWEWQARKQFAQDRRRLSALASIHEDAAATFENGKDRTEVENASSTLGADSIEAILMSSDSSDNMVCLDSEKEANTGPDKNQQVHSDDEPTTIRVKGLDDTIMNLQVSPNIAIGIALKHYATISELDYSKLEFSFHNMLLRSQQTPHLLGMRDGDVIVCQLGPDRNLLRKPAPGIGAMPAVPADEVSLSAFDLPLPRADLTAAASEEEITRTTVQQVNGETNRVHVDVTDGAQVADSLVSVSAARNMPWSQKQAAANQDSTGPEMCVEEESATEPVQVSMEEAGDKPVDGSSGALSQNADTGTSGTSISVPRAGELTGDCAGEDMAESRINGQDSAMSSKWQANAAEQPPPSSNAQARHAGDATSRHAVTHAMEHTLDRIQSEDRDSLGRLRLETVKRLMDRFEGQHLVRKSREQQQLAEPPTSQRSPACPERPRELAAHMVDSLSTSILGHASSHLKQAMPTLNQAAHEMTSVRECQAADRLASAALDALSQSSSLRLSPIRHSGDHEDSSEFGPLLPEIEINSTFFDAAEGDLDARQGAEPVQVVTQVIEGLHVFDEEAGAEPVDGSSGALSQNADTGTSGTSIPAPEMCVEEESATEPVQVSMEEAGDKPVDCSSGALSQNADTGTSGTSISVPRAGELTGDCAGEDMAESRINGQDSAMSSSDTIASAESPETSPGPSAQADVSRPPSRPPPSPPRAKSVEAKGATLPQQDGAGASSSWGQDKMIIVTKETEGKERKAAKVMKQVSDMGRQVFARMGSIKMGVRGQADRGAGRETGAHKN